MLTQIYNPGFDLESTAKKALTQMRSRYRLALRGAVAIQGYRAHSGIPCYRLHVPLAGTGFSAAEFGSALWAVAESLAREADAKRDRRGR